jgi:hypothetical protein
MRSTPPIQSRSIRIDNLAELSAALREERKCESAAVDGCRCLSKCQCALQ